MTWTWPTPQNVKQPYLYLKFRLGTVPHTPPPPPPKSLSTCLMTDWVYPRYTLSACWITPSKGQRFAMYKSLSQHSVDNGNISENLNLGIPFK